MRAWGGLGRVGVVPCSYYIILYNIFSEREFRKQDETQGPSGLPKMQGHEVGPIRKVGQYTQRQTQASEQVRDSLTKTLNFVT